METNENSQSCYKGFGSKYKKVCIVGVIIVALAVILLGLASVGWKLHQYKNGFSMNDADYSRCGKMIRYDGLSCSGPVQPNPNDQFILPQDALINGEIAIAVSNLELAKKAVTDVSLKNEGTVYSTFISYALKNLRNGSMVIQVPAENFDNAFADLKRIGTQVIQESSQKIPANNFYYPMAANTTNAPTPVSAQENTDTSADIQVPEVKPEVAIYPAPTQLAQDKGYIKIIFADYGVNIKNNERNEKENFAGSFFSAGNSNGQSMKNNFVVVLGVKLIFLVAVFGLMILVFKRIFQVFKGKKNKITKVHVVRQMTKTNKRVVKIAIKKNKI